MSRLFWKLFLAIFLAQVLTAWGVGVLFWLERPARQQNWGPPPPEAIGRETVPPDFAPPRPPGPGPRPGPHGIPWQPMAIGLVASLLFAALLARHLARPILGLRKAFEHVAQGQFDAPLEIRNRRWPDELSDLAIDFNRTASQIKTLIHTQRRLLHDVSHEVRSPLARIQLAIDLARQQPEKTSESMARLERESARINHLVEELLTLSRLEAGACGAFDEKIDLPGLLRELVEDARFEASAKSCQVELISEPEALVLGREDLLLRAIENVLRNAIRHTPPGSVLVTSLHCFGKDLCIAVEDSGPGVAESALEAIFDPFVRLQDQRSHDGYGLGLAITRQIIEAHGGSVRAMNREHGGLRVEMHLPLAEAAAA